MRDLDQMAALQEILAAAQTRNLHPMLLKGLAVHLRAYPQDTARGALDIDLLIQPAEMPLFVQCLEELGFFALSDWSALIKRTNEATFHRSGDGISIDLHWSLCAPVEEFAVGLHLSEWLWKTHRKISLFGNSCRVPEREEEILFLCVHLLKASPFLLRNLSDLLHLLHASPTVDWQRFLSLAQSTGTRALAYYALELVSTAEPGLVPELVRTGLVRFSGPRWLISPFLNLDRLVKTQGQELTNLSLRWRGAFFSGRPWIWIPYQTALGGKRLLRQIQAVLRCLSKSRRAISSAG